MKTSHDRGGRGLILALMLCVGGGCGCAAAVDYAEARHVDAWLRHPVYGDPSFDSFVRSPANPVQRGAPPFEWPVNGFYFEDPVGGKRYLYVGEYGRGYMQPPSRCRLHRSEDGGKSWVDLGIVLQGEASLFDRGGHTPDVSVVYDQGRYHMVYDWGEVDFSKEGGIAYAWAERPEGPWHRAERPITRNTQLRPLLGRYQRTYAATLVRRKQDWMVLAMMDDAPARWALFAMTAPRPEGPWTERKLLLHVERDTFHPPLLEFFPAFTHADYVYAPATSVALNRNFNAMFRAPLQEADRPEAWSLYRHGSLWHAEDVEHERDGLWGQTFAGAVDRRGMFRVLFPCRDTEARGTINVAERAWKKPFRSRGFVLSGHQGPAQTLLLEAHAQVDLRARFRWRGQVELLLDYGAPLEPEQPTSDASLSATMRESPVTLRLTNGMWSVLQIDGAGRQQLCGTGVLPEGQSIDLHLVRKDRALALQWNREQPSVVPEAFPPGEGTGVLGWRVGARSRLEMERFELRGKPGPALVRWGARDALLGAGERLADWEMNSAEPFRFGHGAVSKHAGARVKWNVTGRYITLWSPTGPDFGEVELRLDGRAVGTIDLRKESRVASQPVWESGELAGDFHALVLLSKQGRLPVDSLETRSQPGSGRAR